MVGSADKIGGLGPLHDSSRTDGTKSGDGSNKPTLKHSASGSDTVTIRSSLADQAEREAAELARLPVRGTKLTPPQPNQGQLARRLASLGYSQNQIAEVTSQAREQNIFGLPSLEDYAADSEHYELRSVGDGRGYQEINELFGQQVHDKQLARMFQIMSQRQLLDQQKDQEMARVFLAMSSIAYNPKYAVAKLGQLAGSLSDPDAKAFAAGQLSNAASFASQWAKKVAKEDPQFAESLSRALKGVVSQASSSLHNHGSDATVHFHQGGHDHAPGTQVAGSGHHHEVGHNHEVSEVNHAAHQHEATEVAHVGEHEHSGPTEEREIQVIDKHTGECVDRFFVNVHIHHNDAYAMDHAHEAEHLGVDHASDRSIAETAAALDRTAKDARVIHEQHEDEQLALETARDQAISDQANLDTQKKIDYQLAQNGSNAEKTRALQNERASTEGGGSGRIIARA